MSLVMPSSTEFTVLARWCLIIAKGTRQQPEVVGRLTQVDRRPHRTLTLAHQRTAEASQEAIGLNGAVGAVV